MKKERAPGKEKYYYFIYDVITWEIFYKRSSIYYSRSARNPATILQADLLGFATPVTKMEILVTGPRH